MTNMTIRLNTDDKKEFSAICEKIGLTASAAFNVFVKAVIHEQKIPFELSAKDNSFFTEANIKYLEALKKLDDENKLHFTEHSLEEIDKVVEQRN